MALVFANKEHGDDIDKVDRKDLAIDSKEMLEVKKTGFVEQRQQDISTLSSSGLVSGASGSVMAKLLERLRVSLPRSNTLRH